MVSIPLRFHGALFALLWAIFTQWLTRHQTSAFTGLALRHLSTAHDVVLSLADSVKAPSPRVETDRASVQVTEDSLRIPQEGDSIFDLVAGRAAICLYESDMRRDAIGKSAGIQASSATNWINDASAFALNRAFDKIQLKLADQRTGLDRDEASSWIRWIKSVPAPTLVDFSDDFRANINATLSDQALEVIDQRRTDFLRRLGCRLILLPSGCALSQSLSEPPASIIFGKLLYGGVTRYRLLVSSNSHSLPRRAGERSEVKTRVQDNIPAWMMYGGPDRMYESLDMGPAAVLEVFLLPRGKTVPSVLQGNMGITALAWKPRNIFDFDRVDDQPRNNTDQAELHEGLVTAENGINGYSPSSLSGRDRNEAFRSSFRSAVGGLQPQIDAIVRRVLDGRVIRPAEEEGLAQTSKNDKTSVGLSTAALEAEELALLGLTPVRGLLLYGPPGCGKTALAREISRALRARSPKIVAAPELLDRWVGGSEKLVRALFADAEAELAACNGDVSKSALHVVVIDEIDAVFRKRTAAEDSGEATRSSVVNQILAKLDGVRAISNVLLIGMTNRRELLDEALLRPGRLEVQIEIPLPNKEGRREIMQIHFDALRKRGRLSRPLCCAIDGVPLSQEQPDAADSIKVSVERTRKRLLRRGWNSILRAVPNIVRPYHDLAADSATGGFSGADIAGLVRCAGSLALARARKDGSGVEGLLITLQDVKQAIKEVRR